MLQSRLCAIVVSGFWYSRKYFAWGGDSFGVLLNPVLSGAEEGETERQREGELSSMTAQLNARVLILWVDLHAWAMGQEMTRTGALEHSIRVFNWMKAQRCYRARNDIYNNMIWLHARHQRAEQARGLFFEMQEWRSAAILFFFLFVER